MNLLFLLWPKYCAIKRVIRGGLTFNFFAEQSVTNVQKKEYGLGSSSVGLARECDFDYFSEDIQ